MTDWWTVIQIVVMGVLVPVIGGLASWIWKLETRLFDLKGSILTRDEFRGEILGLRNEISFLRESLMRSQFEKKSGD